MKTGIELITEERQRQITEEGYQPYMDERNYPNGELANAAGCYALQPTQRYFSYERNCPHAWPWDTKFWKPSPDRLRDLVKAGALILAEIERIQNQDK